MVKCMSRLGLMVVMSVSSLLAWGQAAAPAATKMAEKPATVEQETLMAAPAIEMSADKVRADQVVDQVTSEILQLIQRAQTKNMTPEESAKALDDLLSPVVSFGYIASRVMGKQYAKQATVAQRRAFVAAFKQSLINTYSKGMSSFVGQEVTVVPTAKEKLGKKRLNVLQTVKGANGTNKVYYTLMVNKKGNWQLINVILDGIDLRKTFQMQFDRAVKTNKGDVAAAVAQWGKR